MFQVAVCDDEAVFLDRTVQILHDAFGEMPHAIQTFQTAGAARPCSVSRLTGCCVSSAFCTERSST